MTAQRNRAAIETLVDRTGTTWAEEAGIRLEDEPAPLYQLLVLATLLSARIDASIASAAARELFDAGMGTAEGARLVGLPHTGRGPAATPTTPRAWPRRWSA